MIMLDLDGSVHSFVDGVRNALVAEAPNDFVRWHTANSPAMQWSFWKDWGWDSASAIEIINAKVDQVFSHPITNSNLEFMQALKDFDVSVVTMPWGEGEILQTCMDAKTKWLEEAGFQGTIKFDADKSGDWKVVIEDEPNNAVKALEQGSKVIFVTQTYNLPGAPVCVEAGLDESKILRVGWNNLSVDHIESLLS